MELGDQIRQLRIERGLLQDDLAAAVYVSRQTVSSWENDKTYPDVQSLVLLRSMSASACSSRSSTKSAASSHLRTTSDS